MGKSSAPPAPDYTAAANAQADASRNITTQQTWANRPNVSTPWGSQTWSAGQGVDPATGQAVTNWSSNISLSPQQQQALDSQMAVQQGRSQTAQDMLGRVQGSVQSPVDWGSVPGQGQALNPSQFGVQAPGIQGQGAPGGKGSRPPGPPGSESVLMAGGGGGRQGGGMPQKGQPSQAPQLQTGVQQQWTQAGPQMQADPRTQTQWTGNNANQIQTGLGPQGSLQNTIAGAGPIQGQVNQQAGGDQFSLMQRQQQQMQGMPGAQTGIANPGAIQGSLGQTPEQWRQQGQSAVEKLQQPGLDQRQNALESQLANQGIPRNSEAWNNAMREMGDERSRAGLQAVAAGRDEAGQLFNQGLQSGQFTNAAQNQNYGQLMGQAGLFNQGQGQNFGQSMNQAQFAAGQGGDAFGRALQGGQFANSAQGQQFGQNQAQQQAWNAAQGQGFGQALQGGQFTNSALGQQFGQGMQANNQNFNQNLAGSNQAFNQRMQAAGQNFGQQLQANQANFGQGFQNAGLNNQAVNQGFNNNLQAQQFGANNQNTAFNQQQQLHQQGLADLLMQRNQPLNEMNAFLSGQQVQMPQMPSFNTAGASQAPQLLSAAQNQYNAALNGYNAGQMGGAGMMSGLFSLGSAAMPFLL